LELKDTVVNISRVTKVVKGGKNLSFSALVVVGDGHGVVGFGIGKAKEVPSAIKKAIEAAKKVLVRVPMSGTSIPHPALGQFGAGEIAAAHLATEDRLQRRLVAAGCGDGAPRHVVDDLGVDVQPGPKDGQPRPFCRSVNPLALAHLNANASVSLGSNLHG